MKVLLINTEDKAGGASIACKRLLQALSTHPNIEVHLLVYQKKTETLLVYGYADTFWKRKWALLNFIKERIYFLFFEKNKKVRYAFSPAYAGVDISTHPLVQEADIIHLHWINFGFLSLSSIQKLFALGKPIVWTMHDMWAFTGGCHYAGNCTNYQLDCGNCHAFLKRPGNKDLSNLILSKKKDVFKQINPSLRLVGCSQWMADQASGSSLVKENQIQTQAIPNPIDTSLFRPIDKIEARMQLGLSGKAFYILFGAMNIADPRKGFYFLEEALHKMKNSGNPLFQKIELIVFGKAEQEVLNKLPFPIHYLGSIQDTEKLVNVYSAAHLFVTPSLEDNLPNTVMESMACATPVLAFKTGGIPEMIDHQRNGYLGADFSADSLSDGIFYFLNLEDALYAEASRQAREKVLQKYNESVVAAAYQELYLSLIAQKN